MNKRRGEGGGDVRERKGDVFKILILVLYTHTHTRTRGHTQRPMKKFVYVYKVTPFLRWKSEHLLSLDDRNIWKKTPFSIFDIIPRYNKILLVI